MKNKQTPIETPRTGLTRAQRQQLNEQHAKHMWYLELVIAACLGAALALSFVVAHQMLTTQWAW